MHRAVPMILMPAVVLPLFRATEGHARRVEDRSTGVSFGLRLPAEARRESVQARDMMAQLAMLPLLCRWLIRRWRILAGLVEFELWRRYLLCNVPLQSSCV